MKTSKFWINKLDLLSHPEGGYFKEVYRSSEKIDLSSLPLGFNGNRSLSTSIYFLLEKGQFSAFHKIKSDEIWHFYDGNPLTIYVINVEGNIEQYKLGLDPDNNFLPQVTIPANCWFAAATKGDYTLVGCTVSPGFDFHDFTMADRNELINQFPVHRKIIEDFTLDDQ